MTQQPIDVISVRTATPQEIKENSLPVTSNMVVTISSDEDFETINPKMSFGFVAVRNWEDYQLPQEELATKHLIFDVVDLKKTEPKQYQFFIDASLLIPHTSVFCRLERPGFVSTPGYKSEIFELKFK